VELIFVA